LSQKDLTSKDLWKLVKPTVRQCESDDGVLVIDDSIEGKPHSKENGENSKQSLLCGNLRIR
jgi:hypothetical protein